MLPAVDTDNIVLIVPECIVDSGLVGFEPGHIADFGAVLLERSNSPSFLFVQSLAEISSAVLKNLRAFRFWFLKNYEKFKCSHS